MKKTILSVMALAALSCTSAMAQVNPSDAAVVYYMPKTAIVLDIEYEEIVKTQGPFYQYSERYLGTKDVVLENATTYAIREVRIKTHAEADLSRAYSFTPSAQTVQSFKLNKDGILEGINLEGEEPVVAKGEKEESCEEIRPNVMPLLEEQMLASSVAKMAESTAKQIYHIREARLNLVSGDVDKMPADGESMKLMLNELQKQEDALVALFVGEQKRVIRHKQICYIPENSQELSDKAIFRFSQFVGPVDEDDLSGEPYYLSIRPTNVPQQTAAPKKAVAASPIYYNIPGTAVVSLSDGEKTIAEKSISIAQYGFAVPLPAEMVKSGAKVRLCTKTGAIISAE